MNVRATVGFSGYDLSMYEGEVRNVSDDVAAMYVKCGYLVEAEPNKPQKKTKRK